MDNHESPPYKAHTDEGTHRVVDHAGQTVCVCGTFADAQQYAVILNQAYELGYKMGYRAAKATQKGR